MLVKRILGRVLKIGTGGGAAPGADQGGDGEAEAVGGEGERGHAEGFISAGPAAQIPRERGLLRDAGRGERRDGEGNHSGVPESQPQEPPGQQTASQY